MNEGIAEPEEPGAVDNRLSLIPSDFPVIEDWQDGEEYSLSELGADVKIRQISPGEFEVMPGAPAPEEEEPVPAAPAARNGGYKNPAVAAMAEEA
jgi:hypothetical protein